MALVAPLHLLLIVKLEMMAKVQHLAPLHPLAAGAAGMEFHLKQMVEMEVRVVVQEDLILAHKRMVDQETLLALLHLREIMGDQPMRTIVVQMVPAAVAHLRLEITMSLLRLRQIILAVQEVMAQRQLFLAHL
ncbi:MAG: hypothetical protein EBU08_14605 [Micrococcales bacterium]|nr:hypothetical protein [Micrococcales bacterium]